MSDFNHKEASEQIARRYGVEPAYEVSRRTLTDRGYMWVNKYIHLTQDLGALMSLAVRNGVDVDQWQKIKEVECVWIVDDTNNFAEHITEKYADHNNDPIEATLVAIYKALIKKGGE